MNRPGPSSFARFCLIGAVGFILDAGILTTLVNGLAWHHYPARALSFAFAVSATWLLNRTWTFRRTDDARSEYTRYLSIQAIGALINLGTYVLVIELVPYLAGMPVIPLGIGASLALVFNFLASRQFVFLPGRQTQQQARGEPPDSSYSGRENLEAMKHAKRYNSYLETLVLRHARDGTVLDFGAGAGTFAIPLSAAGLCVACIEPDTALRQNLEAAGLKVHESLSTIPEQSCDYIYSLNVLEHIEDDDTMLDALAARLKPGGTLLLYVPAFEILYSSMDARVGHFRRYRRQGLRSLVEATGLQVQTARYVDCLGFLATLLFKCFGNDSGTLDAASVRLYDRFAFPVSRTADFLLGACFGKNLLLVASRPRTGGGKRSPEALARA